MIEKPQPTEDKKEGESENTPSKEEIEKLSTEKKKIDKQGKATKNKEKKKKDRYW